MSVQGPIFWVVIYQKGPAQPFVQFFPKVKKKALLYFNCFTCSEVQLIQLIEFQTNYCWIQYVHADIDDNLSREMGFPTLSKASNHIQPKSELDIGQIRNRIGPSFFFHSVVFES